MTEAQLRTLRNELKNDPQSYGYSVYIAKGNDVVLAEMLNTVRDNITVLKDTIKSYELFECITVSDWSNVTLTVLQKQILQMMFSMNEISLKGQNTREVLSSIFGANSDTKANIIALQTRKISRAEQLGLSSVTITDVGNALRSIS